MRLPDHLRALTRVSIAATLLGCVAVFGAPPRTEPPLTLRVGVALPEANSMVGLPAIAEALSSERLFGLDLDGRVTPRLVDRWSASTDGLSLRLTLPTNLRLHDDTPADAGTIASLINDALRNSDFRQMHSRLKGFYEISVADRSTLLLKSRSARILALEELANITLKTGEPDGGLGPFVVESLTGDGLRLHAFERYFRGAPKLQHVEFQGYRSQRSAWTGMMRDATDALYEVNREAVDFVERETRVQTHSFLRPYVSALVFNVSQPVFRDPEVRRALAAAVDRAAIVESVYRRRARPATGPLSPTYWAVAGQTSGRTHDASLATALLARYEPRLRPHEMPARLRFRCLVPTFETQPLERTALVIQKQLYDFGVDVQLELISVRDLLPRMASGDYEALLMEFFGISPSWMSFFWHSGPQRLIDTGYAAADRELERLDAARDEQELRTAIDAVYRKMADDPPAIFIAWPEVTRAVSTRFEVPVQKGRDVMMGGNLRLWRPAPQQ